MIRFSFRSSRPVPKGILSEVVGLLSLSNWLEGPILVIITLRITPSHPGLEGQHAVESSSSSSLVSSIGVVNGG